MNALLVVLSLLCAQSAAARRAAREVVEAFGRETIEAAEPRVVRLVEAYGEEAATVLRKVGPSGVQAMERFGAPACASLPAGATTGSGCCRSKANPPWRRWRATGRGPWT